MGGNLTLLAETHALFSHCYTTDPSKRIAPQAVNAYGAFSSLRAGDGSRTRDLQLGKLMLYRLSYARVIKNLAGAGRRLKAAQPPPSFPDSERRLSLHPGIQPAYGEMTSYR